MTLTSSFAILSFSNDSSTLFSFNPISTSFFLTSSSCFRTNFTTKLNSLYSSSRCSSNSLRRCSKPFSPSSNSSQRFWKLFSFNPNCSCFNSSSL
ncbi:Uncharacterized protein TCM_025940 [Theobroma cacao]|uniref:Uncharacterized protein n=1 Tax=Theobroma cacao TaxID=3641 RepID=A0A061EZV1_THECC|nr:Uncharacterized protein TCM_025940 [Theobroma cacao]